MTDQRTRFNKRLASLEEERSSWLTHWRDISDVLQPIRGRFLATDRNEGDRRHNKIVDNTGTRALRIMAAGLMAGMTSPARPWFRLAVADPELGENANVKRWLAECTQLMRDVFARSNIYRALHSMYEELGAFGTASSLLDDNYDAIIRGHTLTVGEYMIAQNHEQIVDTLYREFQMTVGQVVGKFGLKNVSNHVKGLYDRGSYDSWITVVHAIEPRMERDPGKRDPKNMPWRSIYFEKGCNEKDYLSESGFRDFRVLAPRWSVIGSDVYGRGPGMDALGDVEQLQRNQVMKGKAIDYQADPPIQVPASMKGEEDLLPGGTSYYNDATGPSGGIRTAFDVNLRIDYLLEDIRDVRERINSAFYADLFLMISQLETQRTATEIAAREEEKLLMLGPVLERLHNEMLDPLIDVTFNRLVETGTLPPAPEELQGVDLKVEYVSMLAQAQQAVGLGAVDRLLGTVGSVAQFKPDALDKLDTDEMIDGYADMLGVDPDYIVANKDVAMIRQQRAQAQQAQAQAEMAPGAAQAAKTLSEVDPEQLRQVTGQFSGL